MSNTRVRLPDGSYVNVPTSDPKAAAAAAQKHWQQKQTQEPRGFFDTAADFVDTAVDNVLPNWGDELRGAGRAAKAIVSGKDPVAAFREGQRSFKADQKRFKKAHPTAHTIATGGGMVTGAVLPAGRVLEGANVAQRAAQGARVGAAYGAASGAGEGEGADIPRRATNALNGAAWGAGAGATIAPAMTGAQHAGRWARQNVPGVDVAARTLARVPRAVIQAATGARQRAPRSAAAAQGDRLAASRMNAGNIANGPALNGPQATPQRIEREVADRQAVGVPAMIGDVTEPMRELTEWSSRGMGPGQSLVRQRLAERKATEGTRVRQHVRDTMPTVDDPIAFVEQQKRAARAAADPLYQEAYGQPVYRTPPIQAIEQTPAFRNALPQAYDNIRNQIDPATGLPKNPTAMGFRYFDGDPNGLPPTVPYFPLPDRGYVAVDNGLSFEGYDQVTRAMRDAGQQAANVNPVTGRVQNTTNSVHINARSDDLRNLLREQNGAYDTAVGRYGDDMTYANAFEQGGDIGKLTGHEVNAQVRATPEQAHPAYATGAGTALADAASEYGAKYPNGDTANAVRKMLGDDVKQQALEGVSGNNGGVRALQDRLEYEHQGHINWQGVNGNSKTAARQQLDADLGDQASLPFTSAGVRDRLVNFVVSHAVPQFQRDVKERIAQIVTASDARSVREVIEAIQQQAERDERFADLLHAAGIGISAAYGMNVAPIDQTPEP